MEHKQKPRAGERRILARDCNITWKPYILNFLETCQKIDPEEEEDDVHWSRDTFRIYWPTHAGEFKRVNFKFSSQDGFLRVICPNKLYKRSLQGSISHFKHNEVTKMELFEKTSYLYITIKNPKDVDVDSINWITTDDGAVEISFCRFKRTPKNKQLNV